jgi:DNA-binding response OmpR family regulator
MAGDSQAISKSVSRLRQKLKGSGYTISAEYGNGYRFERGET